MLMFFHFSGTACTHRTLGKAAHGLYAVIHDDRACRGYIKAEPGWDLDDKVASLLARLSEIASFGAQYIGRFCGMAEAGQFNGIIGQFNADKPAILGQDHVFMTSPGLIGDVIGAARGVSARSVEGFLGRNGEKKLAPNAWAVRTRLPKLPCFDSPSTPMAKYPRMLSSAIGPEVSFMQ